MESTSPHKDPKSGLTKRGKIKGTITGSRPSGWWFEMKDEQTYQDQLDYLYGVKKKVITKEAIARMNFGTKMEDHAMFEFIRWTVMQRRDMYVFECGFRRNKTYDELGVPLGASPDGLISEYFYGLVIDETESEAIAFTSMKKAKFAEKQFQKIMCIHNLCWPRRSMIHLKIMELQKKS